MAISIFSDRIELANGEVLKTLSGDVTDGGIVESGSNENGSWTKYTDGTMEIVKEVAVNTTVSVSLGNVFVNDSSSPVSVGSYPQTFYSPPTETASIGAPLGSAATAAWLMGRDHLTTSVGGSYYIVRPTSTAAGNYVIRAIAKGRWKA